jgi:hypothetical protein
MKSRGHKLLCCLHSLLNGKIRKFQIEVGDDKLVIFPPSNFADTLKSILRSLGGRGPQVKNSRPQ